MGCCYVSTGCFEIKSNKGAKLRPQSSLNSSAVFFTYEQLYAFMRSPPPCNCWQSCLLDFTLSRLTGVRQRRQVNQTDVPVKMNLRDACLMWSVPHWLCHISVDWFQFSSFMIFRMICRLVWTDGTEQGCIYCKAETWKQVAYIYGQPFPRAVFFFPFYIKLTKAV